MFKKLRVAISSAVFCLLTFYFLDFAEILPVEFHALGHIQFVPALISGAVAIVICIVLFTLLFGRIYCSTICPMGFLQDVIRRIASPIPCPLPKADKLKFTILRWSVLAITIILFLSGFTLAAGIMDPYSAYGRIAVHILKPVYMFMNNNVASVLDHTFYKVEIVMLGTFSFTVALLSFVIISVLVWTNGRIYCNTLCPVGTILGFLNKFSIFKIKIKTDECTSCGICAKKCKASCIDALAKTIDYTKCVSCFNCMNYCHRGATSWEPSWPKNTDVDKSKRKFLLTGLTTIATVPVFAHVGAVGAVGAQNLVPLQPQRVPISPPGAGSAEHLLKNCTSCHLCVSKCPSKVLLPAFMEYGISGMMMPVMNFERGFCNFDCTLCTQVCPSHALTPITKEQKHLLQVGKVVFIPELCVVHTDGTSCGACSEHCPTQAVKMVPHKNGVTKPFIDVDICVGCGGCEFICPVRPQKAIYVEGNKVHKQANPFDVEKTEEKEIMDFGF